MFTQIKKNLAFLSLAFLACACNEKVTQNAPYGTLDQFPVIAEKTVVGEDTLITCDITEVDQAYSIKLSDLVSSFEMVKLDNQDDALIREKRLVEVSDHYIGIIGEPGYKLFDRQGNYLCDVGAEGQGPGEYDAICDVQIDEANDRIYLLAFQTKNILAYNLKGEYLFSIPLCCKELPKGQINVETEKGIVTVVALPFSNYNLHTVWKQDFDGNLIEGVTLPHLEVHPDFSNEIQGNMPARDSLSSFYITRAATTQDTLYRYNTVANEIKPQFTAILPLNGNQNVPFHNYIEYPTFYVVEIKEKVMKGADYTGATTGKIIIDKKTLKGGYFDLLVDQVGGIPYNQYFAFSRHGYFIMNIEPGNLEDEIKSALKHQKALTEEDKKKLNAFLEEVSSADQTNNYLFLGKWKTR